MTRYFHGQARACSIHGATAFDPPTILDSVEQREKRVRCFMIVLAFKQEEVKVSEIADATCGAKLNFREI